MGAERESRFGKTKKNERVMYACMRVLKKILKIEKKKRIGSSCVCGCKKRLMVVCVKEEKARGRIKGQSLIENVGCMVALRACKREWREKKKRN